jgi:site-specific DNA recombinase
MASLNAFHSRPDGEKVKVGLERKFLDGGTIGVARIGYLNIREDANGRDVAAIGIDEKHVALVQLAFDLAATGDHTITTITGILEHAGLRTLGSYKRPSKPMTRSMVHRLLRDDYYAGIVTHNGVKGDGRHEALIDRATFDQVQKVLDGHHISGDRSHKHHHYLKGTLYCIYGKRLGYRRHRGKCGGQYEYCVVRVQPALEDGVLPIGVSHLLLHKWPEPDDADADIPPAGSGDDARYGVADSSHTRQWAPARRS